MTSTSARAAAVVVAGGMAAGGLLLAAGVAGASPSDRPCGIDDVTVSVAPDAGAAAGQEAYAISYTAASPTTNCKLQGVPTGVNFVAGHDNGSDITVTPDAPGAPGDPVNLTAQHPAVSYLLQDAAAPVTFVPTAMNLNLPSADGSTTTIAWPAGAPLKGDTVELTAVAPA
ncbi:MULTISPECIES: DUF4232 domain-containing protein [Amycolatopsis]|uniref:DUF4232 domain-containing protein n=2 Tax=Amycolatopsis TaxID=1813 RepID=A0A1I4BP35_9PSEU|nr:DUF4232 domain-containing protein [Amycolatopsis sacchari]SFK69769.1 hypothetical protein SAMN05421835_12939 [Amycolatopsis sacchari]